MVLFVWGYARAILVLALSVVNIHSMRAPLSLRCCSTLASILEVKAFAPPRLGGDRRTDFADQLGRALVEADHRALGVACLTMGSRVSL